MAASWMENSPDMGGKGYMNDEWMGSKGYSMCGKGFMDRQGMEMNDIRMGSKGFMDAPWM